jgi:CDP-diacylglycerol pyrophosphatase
MRNRIFLGLVLFVILVFCSAAMLLAWADHNRPDPLMDYVPQEKGVYDTVYSQLAEEDCRGCHDVEHGGCVG